MWSLLIIGRIVSKDLFLVTTIILDIGFKLKISFFKALKLSNRIV